MKEKANAFGVEEETKKERETAVSSSKIPSKEAAVAAAAVLRLCWGLTAAVRGRL